MIEFFSETDFKLENPDQVIDWIKDTINSENHKLGSLSFIFCDDNFLHNINVEFLNHDTLTDIITFDYNLGKEINGEIYVSIERIRENATEFDVSFEEEFHRVIIHGVLHLCGYKDKSKEDENQMRLKESFYLKSLLS